MYVIPLIICMFQMAGTSFDGTAFQDGYDDQGNELTYQHLMVRFVTLIYKFLCSIVS